MLRRSYDGVTMGLRRGYEGNQGKSAHHYGLATVSATASHPRSGACCLTSELARCSNSFPCCVSLFSGLISLVIAGVKHSRRAHEDLCHVPVPLARPHRPTLRAPGWLPCPPPSSKTRS